MLGSLNTGEPQVTDTYRAAGGGYRSNLPIRVGDLLRECTPHGAAAGRVVIGPIGPGPTGAIASPCPVPFTRSRLSAPNGWGLLGAMTRLTHEDRLELAIGDVLTGVKNPILRPMLRQLLAGPHVRDDGLPAYDAFRKNSIRREDLEPHRWSRAAQRKGSPIRAVIAAVAHDLGAVELVVKNPISLTLDEVIEIRTEVARIYFPDSVEETLATWEGGPDDLPLDVSVSWLLGLHDHELHVHDRLSFREHARGAQRYLVRGRELLSALGAWPWTEVPQGQLKKGWRSDPSIVDALYTWHSQACEEANAATAAAQRALISR